ncbi:MAG: lysophospholipid acyltransferase family protein [Balneolaceae bacterium]
MGFTFRKNERGYSEISFPFMRNTIIPATNLLFNVRITNRQHMPVTGPCFIYGNHSNYFDPFLINAGMTQEPTAGVMTRDQFHKMLPRIFMDSIGIVPTSKYIPEPGIIRDVMKMIDMSRMIVIFPEGGRRWDGRPKPVIGTTLKLFWKMKIPVHPVQLHGSHLGWPRWARRPRRSSIEARWLPPLHASDFNNFESFEAACLSGLDFEEYDPPAGTVPFSSWRPAGGIERLLYRCPETGENAAVFTPDGDRVCSRTAGFEYKMDHSSRLVDKYGQSHSVIDMYDRINEMAMVMDGEGCLLRETGSRFYTVDNQHRLVKLDRGVVSLTAEGVAFSYGSDSGVIPFGKINYHSVEQPHKFSITTSRRTLQFTLSRHSSLQWQHYLLRLKHGEQPLKSL